VKTIVARIFQVGMAFFALCSASGQTRTLRIVTYNIEADTGGFSAARPGLSAKGLAFAA